MRKFQRKSWFFVRTAVILLSAAALFSVASVHASTGKLKENSARTDKVLSGITYITDVSKRETQQVSNLLELDPLSDADRGRIYKSLAELSYLSGEESSYNSAVAHAVFYLDSAGLLEERAELFIEYIGRLYSNGSYNAARELLDEIDARYPVNLYVNKRIAASYYLTYFDVAEMLGDMDVAADMQGYAGTIVSELEDDGDYPLLKAKYDLLSARFCFMLGNVVSAREYMSGYSLFDTLGKPEGNQYVICDFILPYNELTAKLNIRSGNYAKAISDIDNYLNNCNNYNFRMMKYNLLRYVTNPVIDKEGMLASRYALELDKASAEVLTALEEKYGGAMLSNVSTVIMQLEYDAKSAKTIRTAVEASAVVLLVIGLGSAIVAAVLIRMSYDSLTKLRSRRSYDKIIAKLGRHKNSFALLVLDIDDFKLINDLHGHRTGDEVLRSISSILNEYCSDNIHCYRYGGEEFCVLFRSRAIGAAARIAGEIREKVERYGIDSGLGVTFSGGLADAEVTLGAQAGADCFSRADNALYRAKKSGKNRIEADKKEN